jgi:hypothetical protein
VARKYARTPEEGKAFRDAVRATLVCPLGCGASDVPIRPHRLSMTAVIAKCLGCGLTFHVEREVLAASVRGKAAKETDPKQQARLVAVADALEPPGSRDGYGAWRRYFEWHDPSLTR